MAGEQYAQWVSGGHPVTGRHGGADRLVGGPQAIGVGEADHRAPRHRTGEGDCPGTRGAYHDAGAGSQVDPPVPRQPGSRRRVEPPYRAGDAVERPPEGARWGHRGRQRSGQDRQGAGTGRGATPLVRVVGTGCHEDGEDQRGRQENAEQCVGWKTAGRGPTRLVGAGHAEQPAARPSRANGVRTRPVDNRPACGERPYRRMICYTALDNGLSSEVRVSYPRRGSTAEAGIRRK